MKVKPIISIVTPSFNQGMYISETIESVLNQNYQNIEHIIVDGGSTDNTLKILKKYSHLKTIVEPDQGQADAINKGFKIATGSIYGYINSDDTLLPGALDHVAQEMTSHKECNIIMGRCRFIDEHGNFIGVEHPSNFESHKRVLEVWKGHMIPQPSVFWRSSVWESCGPMAKDLESNWIDYDLFCRFSKKYDFYFIDEVLATYRLHPQSKTLSLNEKDRLEESIKISRKYWGSPFLLLFWKLNLSLAIYRFDRVRRGHAQLQKANNAMDNKEFIKAMFFALAGVLLAPEMAFFKGIYPKVKDSSTGIIRTALNSLLKMREIYPQTSVYLDHTTVWDDGWVGPRLISSNGDIIGKNKIVINGEVDLTHMSKPLVLTVLSNGTEICRKQINENGEFTINSVLPESLLSSKETFEVTSNTWFVPHRFLKNGDYRPLVWRFKGISFF